VYTHKNSYLAGCTAVTTKICLSIINYDEMPVYTTLNASQMMAIFSHYCEIFKLIPCHYAWTHRFIFFHSIENLLLTNRTNKLQRFRNHSSLQFMKHE